MARNDSVVEQVKTAAKRDPAKTQAPGLLIPSGSTMLDLACSGTVAGAFKPGTMTNTIGDKSSGKTMLALTMLAECARTERLAGYDLIFDDVEAANAFDLVGLFGKKLADRIHPPLKYQRSDTVKELESNIIKSVQKAEAKNGKPFIYVLDSFDALTTDEEVDRAYARAAGTKEKGSMGMQKAKGGHELFRVLCRDIERTQGLLNIISQVKEDIDPMSVQKYKRTGGKALDFYAFHHIWLAMVKSIKTGPADRQKIVGHEVKAMVKKNKLNGAERSAHYNTYNTYGIDDIASMVDFMLVEKFWKSDKAEPEDDGDARKMKRRGGGQDVGKKSAVLNVVELGLTGTRAEIIAAVDEQRLDKKLKGIVRAAWLEIEESLRLDRRPRFT